MLIVGLHPNAEQPMNRAQSLSISIISATATLFFVNACCHRAARNGSSSATTAPKPQVSTVMDPGIAKVIDSYRSAVRAKDADAFMRLYDDHARIFDAWDTWSYEDAGAWRKSVEDWFSSVDTPGIEVRMDDVRVASDQGLAIVDAMITYAGVSAEGKELHSLQNRITWALKLAGNDWKIIHEHTSIPVDFEKSKPIFQPKKAR